MTEDDQRGTGTTRRAVTTAAAWSVPVIGLASAAPAYASSEEIKYSVQGPDYPRGPFALSPHGTGWALNVENLGTGAIPANTITVTILKKPDFFITYATAGGPIPWTRDRNAAGDEAYTYTSALPQRFNPGGGENDPYTAQLYITFVKVPLDKPTPSVARADFTVTGAAPQSLDLEIPY